MSDFNSLKPFIQIGPGFTIRKYLDSRGWSQEDLAQITGLSTKQLSLIINDKVSITIDTAKMLSKAFNTSAEFWINQDTRYRLSKSVDGARES